MMIKPRASRLPLLLKVRLGVAPIHPPPALPLLGPQSHQVAQRLPKSLLQPHHQRPLPLPLQQLRFQPELQLQRSPLLRSPPARPPRASTSFHS